MTSNRAWQAPTVFDEKNGGLRILVVEDDLDSAESLALLLRMFGHEVRIATDGSAALREARANPPDVALLDIGLPGMDGYGLAQRLTELGAQGEKTTRRRPLLVAVTGFGQEEDRRRSREAGIDLHMIKPVDPDQLRRLLQRFQTVLSEMPPAVAN
jgi:CheY-like chemotaxis protein